MYVYVYVCMCVCMYVYVCVCMCMYVCMYVSTVHIHTLRLILRNENFFVSFPILHSGQKVCNDRMFYLIVAQTALPSPHSIPDLVIIAVTNCTVNCYDPGLPSFMQADIALFIFSPTWTFPPIRLSLPHLKPFNAGSPSPLHHISKANEPCPTEKKKKLSPSHDQKSLYEPQKKKKKKKRLAVANGCRVHAAL